MTIQKTTTTEQLFSHLWRGGQHSYYWTPDPYNRSQWFAINGHIPASPPAGNVYFGVNPVGEIPPTNNKNEPKPPEAVRSQIAYISAVNALFGEFDIKDFGSETAISEHLKRFPPASVIIHSGGGYHCYWLLDEPFVITSEAERQRAKNSQYAWVDYVGSDKATKDLARVLRVPGTMNCKPNYAPNFPTVEIIKADFDLLYTLSYLDKQSRPQAEAPKAKTQSSAERPKGDDLQTAKNCLTRLAAWRCEDYQEWINVGMSLSALGTAGLELWDSWSQQSGKYKPGQCEKKWPTFTPGNGLTLASLVHWAREDDPQPVTRPAESTQETPQAEKRPPTPTHDELRDRFLSKNPHVVYGLADWRKYKAGLWPAVSELRVKRLISGVIEAAKGEGVKPTAALLASVTELAKIQTFVDDAIWDAAPDYLVCGNGTLHIPTKTLGQHNPALYATSRVAYAYDPAAIAKHWELFLLDLAIVTSNEVVSFLQEFVGYALTIDTSHEIAVWLYGPPGSGKSTFLEGLQAMLGQRAGLLGLADVVKNRFALATIPGKTLAISAEQPGDFIASTHTLNALISGETITVDRKFRDAIEVTPRCKLAWAMNELPRVSDPNSGLFRRVKVVEFPAIPEAKQNPQLKDLIRLEGAGILNWALVGLDRLRQRGRFDIPKKILDATASFRDTNDIPARFVDECCYTGTDEAGEPYRAQSSQLYTAYNVWCKDTGHKPQSSTSIATDWKRLGFEKRRPGGVNHWFFVGLRNE